MREPRHFPSSNSTHAAAKAAVVIAFHRNLAAVFFFAVFVRSLERKNLSMWTKTATTTRKEAPIDQKSMCAFDRIHFQKKQDYALIVTEIVCSTFQSPHSVEQDTREIVKVKSAENKNWVPRNTHQDNTLSAAESYWRGDIVSLAHGGERVHIFCCASKIKEISHKYFVFFFCDAIEFRSLDLYGFVKTNYEFLLKIKSNNKIAGI